MATSVSRLFGGARRSAVRQARRSRERSGQGPRFESLEHRQVLAVTGLPTVAGNQFGAPIVLTDNYLDATNSLTITLQDQSIGGTTFAVATITANIPGGSVVTNSYWNFANSITFTSKTSDIVNQWNNAVSLTTPYGFNLANGPTAYDWNAACNFVPRAVPNVTVKLTGADSLAVTTTNAPAAYTSTAAGTFQSPTLAGGASITLNSNGSTAITAGGLRTWDFAFNNTKNSPTPMLDLQGAINAGNSITISDVSDVVLTQSLTAGNVIKVTSGQALTSNAVLTSTSGSVSLTAQNSNVLTVNDDIIAKTSITLAGDAGIVIAKAADLVAVTGAVDLTSANGFVNSAGTITATANAVTVNANKGLVRTAEVTALTGYTVNADTDVTFAGPTTITGAGNVAATAASGNIAVLSNAPITVTNGTVALNATAGTVSVDSQVLSNLAITVQAAQGVTLSNAVDATAELRATALTGDVTITSTANQVLVDAPVTSQTGKVSITSTNDDVLIRDDVSALLDLTVTGKTTVTVDGVAPDTVTLTSQTGTIAVTSTAANVTLGPDLVVVAGPGATAGVTLTAQTVVDLQVALAAQGNIVIASPDGFVVQQSLTSNLGAVTITSANGPVTAAVAPITASDAITINGKNTVSIDTTLTSTAAGIALKSDVDNVVLGNASKLVAAAVTTGTIAINAANALLLGSDLAAGNNITVTTGASFAPTKNVTSTTGDITIAVNNGDLDVTGATITVLDPAGDVTLSATGDVSMDPARVAVGIGSGNLSVTAGSGLSVSPWGAISVGGSLTLSSVDPLVGFVPPVGSNFFAKTGSITLKFGGDIDVSNITVQAPLGGISLTSTTGDVTVGTNAFVVETAGTGTITLVATNGAVNLGQSLTAGFDITISADDSFTLTKNLTSNAGSVAITSTGGNVDVSNATISAPLGSITLAATTGTVSLGTKAYTAGTGFSASALDTLKVAAPISTVGGGITLQSTAGDVALTGTANLTALAGTVNLFANGEINNGTVNGAVATTYVLANTLIARAQGALAAGVTPIFAFTNPQNNVDQLEIYLETAGGIAIGSRVTYIDVDSFTVNKFSSATGRVLLESLNGGVTVNANIGQQGNPATTFTLIDVHGPGVVTISGELAANGAGNIAVSSSTNLVTITGPVSAANGTVTITSGGGTGLTVNGAINALGPNGDIALSSSGTVTVNGGVTSTGDVIVTSTAGSIDIAGAVTAGAANDFVGTAAVNVNVGGSIFAGNDITLTAPVNLTLGGALIQANNGAVSVTSTGGTGNITVAAATVSSGDSIVITTKLPGTGTITFNGGSLNAPKPYVPGGTTGLIQIVGNTVAVPGVPTIVGGRLELRSLGVAPIALTGNNSVDSLGVSAGGSFTFTNFSELLQITDFNPTNAKAGEVSTGGNLTITQSMLAGLGGRFRVVDGLSVGGALSLSANQSALGVEFVTTTTGDNPALPPVFAGTLRDMLGYINANVATNGTTNATMSAMFDELGSPLANIGTVSLTASLPNITKRILFDGSLPAVTPGLSIGGDVGLNGTAVPLTVSGLTFATGSGGSTIQDFAVHGFKGAGVELRSGDNTIRSVRSGFDRAGNAAANTVGIRVTGTGAARNFVGTQAVGNEIGNNTGAGIVIQAGASYTSVYGNSIGVKADGTGAPNGSDGIQIVSGRGNVIGPLTTTQGANVISGNRGHGISMLNVLGSAIEFGTRVFNNTISGNTGVGVTIQGGGFNQVGAVTAGNTIGTNKAGGVSITASSAGNVVSANTISLNVGDGVLVSTGWGNRIDGNTVSGNSSSGVRLQNAATSKTQASNRVFSNTIEGNGGSQIDGGVVIEASSGQVVGVDTAGKAAGNTVKLNAGSGIVILNGGGTQLPQSNTVANNSVLQNRFDGIRVQGSLGNLVQANTSTANAGAGISVVNAFAANSKDPRFAQGNVVVANTSSLNSVGILVQGSSTNTVVGGQLVSLGNRVFSNVTHGISVASQGNAVPNGTLVQNNQVGLDASNAPAGNGGDGIALAGAINSVVNYGNSVRHNTGNGLSIVGGNGNFIGSPVRNRANTFVDNDLNGILVDQTTTGTATTTRMTISGNLIDGNDRHGIAVAGARTSNVTIGRAPSIAVPTGDENTISNNGGDGINVTAAQNVTMIGNLFSTNAGLRIRLAGNANGGIATPTITSAVARSKGGKPTWDVAGTVTGRAGDRFYVDFYTDTVNQTTQFLGRVLVTVATNGRGAFRVVLNGSVPASAPVRATQTLANPGLFGGTSQFTT